MFTIEEYLQTPWHDDILEIEVHNERFRIRRLDGLDTLRLYELQDLDERFIHILAVCLLDGQTSQPVGRELAEQFIRRRQQLAIDLTVEIINLSCELAAEEEQRVEEAKKNC
ncbi:MAG: hypothetical protein PHQ75_08690 [Thermoguttaceae bacterium]|nr:hypothetical protein [Thermoguttaceae bacterium]